MSEYRKVYAYKGIEVSESGGVRRAYENSSSLLGQPTYHNLQFKTDKTGNRVVKTKDYGDLRVDMLVAIAFFGNPKGGQRHIIHKDKVKEHCWKSNLQFATTYEYGEFYLDDPIVNTPDGFRLVSSGVYVSRNGEVKVDGTLVAIRDYIYDTDLDSHKAVAPYFERPYTFYGTTKTRREGVAGVVAEAFVPTPQGISCPVLIPKDGDYKNCKADNLEWVESDSESVQLYITKKTAAINQRNNELATMFSGH